MRKADLEARFRAVMKENGWLDGTPVLLGVSGGSDSMALLHLFVRLHGNENIIVAHLDHGVRATARRDCEFVEKTCAALGIKCIVEHRKLDAEARSGESVEQTGRRLRYGLYERISEEHSCAYTALGHTKTDLAESVILNIARGSGLWGLAGIPPRRGNYIRPLLSFGREELRGFLRDNGLTWVEDETNDEDIYTRNRVRHHVLPLLENCVNAQASSHLAELAQEAWQWREQQERTCAELFASVAVPFKEWPAISLSKFRKMGDYSRASLLRFIAGRISLRPISRPQTEKLCSLAAASGRWLFQWGSETDVFAENGAMHFAVASEKRTPSLRLRLGESARWGGWNVAYTENSADADDFGTALPADGNAELVLTSDAASGSAKDRIFPIIAQKNAFTAKRLNGEWVFRQDGVKYPYGPRIVLTPIAGHWRNIKWN